MPNSATIGKLNYDPHLAETHANPYPIYRRLREEAPLYHNERYDFFAVSRYQDVKNVLSDHDRYISGNNTILDLMRTGVTLPPGNLISEDPPTHTIYRGIVSRVLTPKKIKALETQIREFCGRCLDPLIGAGSFDFVNGFANLLPLRVIGMLLGIPEEDQQFFQDFARSQLKNDPGEAWDAPADFLTGAIFSDYVEWRSKNPADDLTTELLQAEFVDRSGAVRRLTRAEVLTMVDVLAIAGFETTGRMLGWAGRLLGDHPDQLQLLVSDPSLIPNAIEEVLRYEPPSQTQTRWVTRDVEFHGELVPASSVILAVFASANRDDLAFPDGDRFDITRKARQHVTFGYSSHFCLGAPLARLEGRIALEEVVKRFPRWQVDSDGAVLSPNLGVRGWATLPILTS